MTSRTSPSLVTSPGVVVTTVGDHGVGVVATRAFARGEVLFACTGRVTTERTRYTIQFDTDLHLDVDEPGKCLNHSCDPNCHLVIDARGLPSAVATRAIAAGEEVAADYATFETRPGSTAGIACACGAKRCRGRIVGWDDLLPAERRRLRSRALPYLRTRTVPASRG